MTPEQEALLRNINAKVEGIFGFAINTEAVLPKLLETATSQDAFMVEVRAKLAELDNGDVTPTEFVDALRAALATD